MILNNILDQIDNEDAENIIIMDGLNDAIIGIDYNNTKLIYSVKKCIEILGHKMPNADAIEFLEFNTFPLYCGPNTPIFCNDQF